MKRLILLLLIALPATILAQTTYKTVTGIDYYEGKKTDAYILERCKVDVYYPTDAKPKATIIWFHGGGLTGGEKEIPEALKNQGFAIVGVGYRLSPKAKVADIIDDATAAIAWTFKNISKYNGADPDKIFLSGHSAGGYLDLMVGLNKKYLQAYGIDANKIAGLIPFSAQTVTHFTKRKEQNIPDTQPTIDEYAPLFFVRADAPPLLLITGDRELEMLGRYEENAYLARMMKINGHKQTRLLELDGYDHGGMPYPAFPLLIKEVNRLLKLNEAN
ncbi:alpha/beta hydrolase [Flavobacterium silvaticum]|uniref:Alpha/beta hydrolase n=1 Tax=Flavobacterium silvaticum TaxID=1852020 RepID=A0A972FSZ2_9FLAO|nr:alpha/beta hydrolase [Flavobacterium silvaticum]NMH27908.1 alpha/beta hydrolase [Flavobacterium silvaticum]